jgi:LacI family transcriptional regulator
VKVTIADVAALAGVGKGTVSRVLNDSPAVSPATRAKVLAAISELDYTPSALARGLSRGRCQTVGVIVPFFTHAPSVAERLRGVVGALDGSRYDLVLYNVESALHRNDHFATLSGRDRADGLLVMSLQPPEGALERLQRRGVPVVLLDAPGELAPSVRIDDVDGGRRATRHLVDLGHTRIGFIGGEPENPLGFSPSRAREEGFRESMAAAGLAVRSDDITHLPYVHDLNAEVGVQLLDRPAGDRPTAVFAASDDLALGVLDAARELDLRVPDDVSVVGFDDLEIARYVGLTTVRQPLHDMGRRAAELLLAALESEEQVPVAVHQLDVELVVRATTAAPGEAGPT